MKRRALLEWIAVTLRAKRLLVALLLLSGVIHAWAIVRMVTPADSDTKGFVTEFVFFVVVSFVVEIPVFAVRRASTLRLLVLLRLCATVIALRILGATEVPVAVLLTVTLFVDVLVYDEGPASSAILGLLSAVLIASLAHQLWNRPTWHAVAYAVEYTLGVGLVGAFSWLAVHYREEVARLLQRIAHLESEVANLTEANRAFQLYADRVESASAEKERNRVIGELHDTVGYALTNTIVMMNAGKVLLDENPSALREVLTTVGAQSERALNEVRQTLYRMKAIPVTERKGLRAIYALAKSFHGATGIQINVHSGNLPWSVGQQLDSVLYHVVQEGLTNSFRHGRASMVSVSFWRAADEIRVAVSDNGSGADVSAPIDEGIGLAGIRERLARYGGQLEARRVPTGFVLEARIPFHNG